MANGLATNSLTQALPVAGTGENPAGHTPATPDKKHFDRAIQPVTAQHANPARFRLQAALSDPAAQWQRLQSPAGKFIAA